jgi:hypothetical protein
MLQDSAKRKKDFIREKQKVRTNMGPEESEETYQRYIDEDKTKKVIINNALKQQMTEKQVKKD